MRALCLLLLLSGCAAFQTGTPLREAKLSPEAVVLHVPVVLQNDRYDCGVSALSMLLAYYGHPADAAKAEPMREKADSQQGLTGAELEEYLKAEGLEVALFEGALTHTIRGLYYHLDRGRPLVVALGLGGGNNHFVLVTGYDPVNDWVLLQDPMRGALVSAAGQFEHSWKQTGRFTLLATPKE